MTPTAPLLIEVWSDIACPFCYIGKRRLAAALAEFPQRDDVQVQWRSYQLQPALVTDPGLSLVDSLATSKGMAPEQVRQMNRHVQAMGDEVGITFDFDRVVVANTFDAHRLLQFAQAQGRGDAMKDRLLEANFTQGANIADRATLERLAVDAGLDAAQVSGLLAGDGYGDEVRRDLAEARQLRITGVPFFLFGRAYAISGAQPLTLFTQALSKAYAEAGR